MRHLRGLLFAGIFVVMMVGSCGPSAEEIATMTAAAWTATPTPTPAPTLTPTPPPTPTPTPIPYDLSVEVLGSEGNPIPWAQVILAESEETLSPDEAGMIHWQNLPGDTISLSATAQGYTPVEQSMNIERGPNEFTLTLERDPLQLHPLEACQPGQELLYLEDFEDNVAQDWGNISRPMWIFEEVEDRGTVLTYSAENTEGFALGLEGIGVFGEVVWQMDMINGGDTFLIMNSAESAQYLMRFNPPGEGLQIIHVEGEDHGANSYRGLRRLPIGEWQHIAIGYYDGSLEFWVDGVLILALDDPDPLGPGSLQIHSNTPGAVSSFDNMVICGLTEPYSPSPSGGE